MTFSSFSSGKWKLATRAAVTTLNASTGAGIWGMLYSYKLTKKYKGKLDVGILTASILGGLVAITAICAICNPWEALLIGLSGGIIATYGEWRGNKLAFVSFKQASQAAPLNSFQEVYAPKMHIFF